eukprot:TRINITY_DN8982_c0_g1_i1.p1 TRINITY_DN8982_c0_g1~~TRINITY_DN8982_c0_g1_i1.p1  ORF type:complete len:134 (-),score=19.20 TRINITY_DN8982_c0_g1_i1:398-799(-)
MKEFEELTNEIREFILAQHYFFVATAPLDPNGHVNTSPKGFNGAFGFISTEAMRVASNNKMPSPQSKAVFVYLDVGGSGIETMAHLQEQGNGRITVCFVSHDKLPKIVRLFGRGFVMRPGDEGQNTKHSGCGR